MNNKSKVKQERLRLDIKENFHRGDRKAVEQAAQRGCVVTIPGDFQDTIT